MELLTAFAILFGSLFLLVKSADYFTDHAEKIGLYFGLSSFIVGATIVSVGSSMPEIMTSIFAVMGGEKTFPVDNVIGSNIANTLLVGGVCALVVGTLSVKKKLIDVDLPFFFISSGLFLLFLLDGKFTWIEGVLSLCLLMVFVLYTIMEPSEEEDSATPDKSVGIWRSVMFVIVAGAFIAGSAKFTVDSVMNIAEILNINTAIVTMIAVAIGTSLPELIVSTRAALAGKHSVALGNIFGSNTFNVLGVMAVPSFFTTLTVSEEALWIGIPFFIVSTLGFIFVTSDDKIKKWEGAALLILYIVFCGKLVMIF